MEANLLPFQGPEHQPFEIGDGPDGVLLIHGFPGTPAEVRGVANVLAENGWRARALLLPGFGPDIINLKDRRRGDWLEVVRQAWQEMRSSCRRCVLFGYSMGAALALNLAVQLKPDGLILPAPFWRLPGVLPKLVPFFRVLTPRVRPFQKVDFDDPRLREQFARIIPDLDLDDPQIQQVIREEFILPLGTIEEVLRMGKDGYRLASQGDVPTLVLQGAQDEIVRPRETRRLLNRFQPGVPHYREINAGHDLLVDDTYHFSYLMDTLLCYLNSEVQ